MQSVDGVLMDAAAILTRQELNDGQHDGDHRDHPKQPLIPHDLERRDLEVRHEKVLERDLGRLDSLSFDTALSHPCRLPRRHCLSILRLLVKCQRAP